jgi:hypothetical protein
MRVTKSLMSSRNEFVSPTFLSRTNRRLPMFNIVWQAENPSRILRKNCLRIPRPAKTAVKFHAGSSGTTRAFPNLVKPLVLSI